MICASLSAALVLLAGPSASAQERHESPESPPSAPAATANEKGAEEHFARALQLFDEGDFKLALVEFQRSFELNPNYRVLYNIGQVQFQLARYADARRSFSRYLAEGGERVQGKRRADVEHDLEALKLRTAQLRLDVDVQDADVLVDGEKIGRSPMADSQLVDAGSHRIEAKRAGFVAAGETVTLVGGDERTVKLHLEAVPPPEPAHVAPASSGLGPVWIGWGLTAALVVGTVGVGIAWLNADSKLSDLKRRESTSGERDEQLRQVNTLQTTTIVLGGAAVVAAGVSLYFTLRRSSSDRAQLPFPVGPVSF